MTASPVRSPERRRGHVRIYGFLALLGASAAAWAAPDTLEAYHHAGPCGDFKFPTLHVQWETGGGSRWRRVKRSTSRFTAMARISRRVSPARTFPGGLSGAEPPRTHV